MRDYEIGPALAEAVHKAHYCHYDEPLGMLLVWNGSLTVNVYDVTIGQEVAMWTLAGGDDGGPADIHDAIESIEGHVEDSSYLELY